MDNIFENIPRKIPKEIFTSIICSGEIHIERIISAGQHTASGEWLSANRNEWVILLTGGAEVRFENEPETYVMRPGDHIYIKRGQRHRVEKTSETEKSVWLAVYF